jgi:hypothetical protein
MDSLDLYHTRQQYALGFPFKHVIFQFLIYVAGSYKPLITAELPDKLSPDYLPTILYKARAQIFSDPSGALLSLPKDNSSYAVRAIRDLATYFNAKSAGHDEQKDKALDSLRDLCIEIEGEELDDDVKGTVRVVAAVAFVKEGELEEAQETLQGDGTMRNLEAYALLIRSHDESCAEETPVSPSQSSYTSLRTESTWQLKSTKWQRNGQMTTCSFSSSKPPSTSSRAQMTTPTPIPSTPNSLTILR